MYCRNKACNLVIFNVSKKICEINLKGFYLMRLFVSLALESPQAKILKKLWSQIAW